MYTAIAGIAPGTSTRTFWDGNSIAYDDLATEIKNVRDRLHEKMMDLFIDEMGPANTDYYQWRAMEDCSAPCSRPTYNQGKPTQQVAVPRGAFVERNRDGKHGFGGSKAAMVGQGFSLEVALAHALKVSHTDTLYTEKSRRGALVHV